MKPLLLIVAAVVVLLVAITASAQSYAEMRTPQNLGPDPLSSVTTAQQQPQGIPVYGLRPAQVGTLYPLPPQPIIVPTVVRYYRPRPTLIGRALFGPYKVRHAPGPYMQYVPR